MTKRKASEQKRRGTKTQNHDFARENGPLQLGVRPLSIELRRLERLPDDGLVVARGRLDIECRLQLLLKHSLERLLRT